MAVRIPSVPGISSYERKIYTEGDCWMLAYYLHHADPNLRVMAACCLECWDHVAVTNGTHVLDAHGWTEIGAWDMRWGGGGYQVYDGTVNNKDEFMRILCYPPGWGWDSSWFRTDAHHKRVAERLLALPRP